MLVWTNTGGVAPSRGDAGPDCNSSWLRKGRVGSYSRVKKAFPPVAPAANCLVSAFPNSV